MSRLREKVVFDGKGKFVTTPRTTCVITETLVISGDTGTGPDLDMSEWIIVPSPEVDWTNKAVVEVAGIRANIRGLVIESPKMERPPAYGLTLSALWDDRGVHQSGGAATIYDAAIHGVFSRSCLLLDSGEQYTFVSPNLENRTLGEGYVVILANGGERGPAHSMTDVQFIGGDYAAYWASKTAGFLIVGEVQEVTIIGGHVAVNGPMIKVLGTRSYNCSAFGVRLESQASQPTLSGNRSGWTLTRCSNNPNSSFPMP